MCCTADTACLSFSHRSDTSVCRGLTTADGVYDDALGDQTVTVPANAAFSHYTASGSCNPPTCGAKTGHGSAFITDADYGSGFVADEAALNKVCTAVSGCDTYVAPLTQHHFVTVSWRWRLERFR